ncbi:receptor-like protein 43 [Gossypium hirsutum]|uniref:Receptor-like protein 43 n=1 Tax=Gossypium hirsutum TaxID=3635 RepID=A0A1U8LUX4_GOSHI|nr:receptor-like protein 43 [Gossypium hirsutum]
MRDDVLPTTSADPPREAGPDGAEIALFSEPEIVPTIPEDVEGGSDDEENVRFKAYSPQPTCIMSIQGVLGSGNVSRSHSCSHHKAASLIQFKNSFSITQTRDAAVYCDDIAGLKSYPKTNSWKEGTDCCSWDGVTCDHLNAHVIALDLSCRLVPRSLGNLLQLNHLDLSWNQLSGQIPRSLGNLLQLTHLVLWQNQLSGKIPRSLGNLLQLTHLSLSGNQLSRQIPLSILNLTQLEYLRIGENSLQGSIPDEVIAFPNLISLSLTGNLLNGTLPSWLYTAPSLKLQFDPWKSFDSSFEDQCLSDSNNSFNGEVSSLICNVTFLQILDLSHNNLSGTIPQCFGNLSDSLGFLNLKKNKFYGTIPLTFAKGCQLSNFNLNGNLLEGPLTPSIFNCKGLEVLDLGNNKINDTFPHWLGSLPQLQVLVLKSNHMHGSLCVNSSKSSPFFFSKIQIFDLSSNYFSGPLPVRYINSFKAIINLEKIGSTVSYMGENDHGGRGFYTYSIGIVIKGQYMELVKIFNMWMIIDLSNNQFEGEIPKVVRDDSK